MENTCTNDYLVSLSLSHVAGDYDCHCSVWTLGFNVCQYTGQNFFSINFINI